MWSMASTQSQILFYFPTFFQHQLKKRDHVQVNLCLQCTSLAVKQYRKAPRSHTFSITTGDFQKSVCPIQIQIKILLVKHNMQ